MNNNQEFDSKKNNFFKKLLIELLKWKKIFIILN